MIKIALIFLSGLFAAITVSVGQAQTPSAEECSAAQADFVAAMGSFRSAYFEREDAEGSAESVMADKVSPSAEKMYQLCPAQLGAAIEAGVEKAKASLTASSRAQLVSCDKALITYNKLLSRFDNTSVAGGYNTYRNLLYSDIDPSAKEAVDACPQMTELASETRVAITERQRRLDRMQDMDNFGSSMADNIATSNAEYLESLEDDE